MQSTPCDEKMGRDLKRMDVETKQLLHPYGNAAAHTKGVSNHSNFENFQKNSMILPSSANLSPCGVEDLTESGESYIMDLRAQKKGREKARHEEALTEALERMKQRGLDPDSDEYAIAFLQVLSKVKEEIKSKHEESDQLLDQRLDEAVNERMVDGAYCDTMPIAPTRVESRPANSNGACDVENYKTPPSSEKDVSPSMPARLDSQATSDPTGAPLPSGVLANNRIHDHTPSAPIRLASELSSSLNYASNYIKTNKPPLCVKCGPPSQPVRLDSERCTGDHDEVGKPCCDNAKDANGLSPKPAKDATLKRSSSSELREIMFVPSNSEKVLKQNPIKTSATRDREVYSPPQSFTKVASHESGDATSTKRSGASSVPPPITSNKSRAQNDSRHEKNPELTFKATTKRADTSVNTRAAQSKSDAVGQAKIESALNWLGGPDHHPTPGSVRSFPIPAKKGPSRARIQKPPRHASADSSLHKISAQANGLFFKGKKKNENIDSVKKPASSKVSVGKQKNVNQKPKFPCKTMPPKASFKEPKILAAKVEKSSTRKEITPQDAFRRRVNSHDSNVVVRKKPIVALTSASPPQARKLAGSSHQQNRANGTATPNPPTSVRKMRPSSVPRKINPSKSMTAAVYTTTPMKGQPKVDGRRSRSKSAERKRSLSPEKRSRSKSAEGKRSQSQERRRSRSKSAERKRSQSLERTFGRERRSRSKSSERGIVQSRERRSRSKSSDRGSVQSRERRCRSKSGERGSVQSKERLRSTSLTKDRPLHRGRRNPAPRCVSNIESNQRSTASLREVNVKVALAPGVSRPTVPNSQRSVVKVKPKGGIVKKKGV